MRAQATRAWCTILAVSGLIPAAGCNEPAKIARLPSGSLHVRYEAAKTYSTCLVASVAMAGNYLLDRRAFDEHRIREDMSRAGLDETRVGDMKRYLSRTPERLYLVTLSGHLDGASPPTSLRYWLEQRGYPVICVINRDPDGNPAYNHAVVVIGISPNVEGGSADIIHYLDPSTSYPLHSDEAAVFEQMWAKGDRAMLLVVRPTS